MKQRLERGELRRDAKFHGVRILIRKLALVGGVDLRVEFDRLYRRPFQTKGLRAIVPIVAHGLRLQ
jgi:hypothetical protein